MGTSGMVVVVVVLATIVGELLVVKVETVAVVKAQAIRTATRMRLATVLQILAAVAAVPMVPVITQRGNLDLEDLVLLSLDTSNAVVFARRCFMSENCVLMMS